MNTRLKQFLAAENISQAQFADTIRVVRASVSHVLAGRNNPSYDFIRAIMDNYPSLNIEWLMLGRGKMYKETPPQSQPPHPIQENVEEIGKTGLLFSDIPEEDSALSVNFESTNGTETIDKDIQTPVRQRNVSKIIILYDDGTFQEM